MDAANNLIELILRLLKDPAALAEFQENPDAVLAACGASDVSAEDVHDALVLASDDDDDNNGGHHNHHVPPPPHPRPGESDHDATVRYIKEYVTNNYVDDRDTVGRQLGEPADRHRRRRPRPGHPHIQLHRLR